MGQAWAQEEGDREEFFTWLALMPSTLCVRSEEASNRPIHWKRKFLFLGQEMRFNFDFQIFRVEDLLRLNGCSRVKFGDRKWLAILGLMIWHFFLFFSPLNSLIIPNLCNFNIQEGVNFEKVVGNEASQKLSGKRNVIWVLL